MKVVIITQARMNSTRLPGKVLKRVLGRPLLSYHVERLRRVRLADEVMVATTTGAADQPIVDLCTELGIRSFRGPEEDVLARYFHAATAAAADFVVRVTADCPIIDPSVVGEVIGFFLGYQDRYDYVSNTLERTYPRGMDTEVFRYGALGEAFAEAADPAEREHVTPFIYRRPGRFRVGQVFLAADESRHRWTVDTAEDFELVRRIIQALAQPDNTFGMHDVLDLLRRHPEWSALNAHVEQKRLGQ